MEITLQVSDQNESTSAPWWCIIDRGRAPNLSAREAGAWADIFTGPFFSREEAQRYLDYNRHNFSRHAEVYCKAAPAYSQYATLYHQQDERRRGMNRTGVSLSEGKAHDVIPKIRSLRKTTGMGLLITKLILEDCDYDEAAALERLLCLREVNPTEDLKNWKCFGHGSTKDRIEYLPNGVCEVCRQRWEQAARYFREAEEFANALRKTEHHTVG